MAAKINASYIAKNTLMIRFGSDCAVALVIADYYALHKVRVNKCTVHQIIGWWYV